MLQHVLSLFHVGGADYQFMKKYITFSPMEIEKNVSISLNTDNINEVLEVFFVELSNSSDGSLGVNSTTISIFDTSGKK